MARAVAFLRGMNVGGHRITNAELRERFEAMGFRDVSTYRASGNVIFDDGDRDRAAVVDLIEQGLGEGLGYRVPTMLRSAAEVMAIVDRNPYAVVEGRGKPQVTLYRKVPTPAEVAEVQSHSTDADLLSVDGPNLYWSPSGGILDTELDLKAITKLMGVGTMRTMGTVTAIAKKLR